MNKLIVITIAILIWTSCKTIQVYDNPKAPYFSVNSYDHQLDSNVLTLLSFNIKTGVTLKNINSSFKAIITNHSPDIILLQEVSEIPVNKIAQLYDYNYIYYPISKSKKNENFGSAILTKYKIVEHCKMILPHKKSNGRIRNATNCTVRIGDDNVLVYSIHNETIVMSKEKRNDQLKYIINDIAENSKNTSRFIVGGDFNTFTKEASDILVGSFSNLKFTNITEDVDYTSIQLNGIMNQKLDHMFTKGFLFVSCTTLKDIRISDHLPILAKVQFLN